MTKAGENPLIEAIFCPNGHIIAGSVYQDEDWIDEKETLIQLGCENKWVPLKDFNEHFGECNCLNIGSKAKNEASQNDQNAAE